MQKVCLKPRDVKTMLGREAKGTITHYYYRKDDMVCAAAEYGLKCISDKIFKYFYSDVSDINLWGYIPCKPSAKPR